MTQAPDLFLGIEIGGTKIQLLVGDHTLNEHHQVTFKVGKVKEAETIKQKLTTEITDLISRHQIKAIGVGFGGPVDSDSGRIYDSFHVSGWRNLNLRSWMEDLSHLPVFVENDANVAALAESVYGSGKSYQRVFYLTLGSGVGSGYVVDGMIYHGKGPSEMEAGHLRLDKHHRTLESSCSGWAVNRKLQEYINEAPACVLAKLVSQQQVDETSCMMEAIAAGDQMVEKIFNETMDDLAHGLSHIVHLLNPDIIIMGGGLSLVGQPLVTAIGDRLPNYLMSTLKNEPPVISLSALQEKSVPIGAIELAKRKIRAEPKS